MSRLHADGYGFGGIGPGVWSTYTPTIVWTANVTSAPVGMYVDSNGILTIFGNFTNTGTGVGAITISLPAGFVAASSVPGTLHVGAFGVLSAFGDGASGRGCGLTVTANAAVLTGAATVAGNSPFSFMAWVPVLG